MRHALLLTLALLTACTGNHLAEYTRHKETPRLIAPDSYIAYLKETRFRNGELDALPRVAIVMHHAEMRARLKELGFDDVTELALGSTDPALLYVVRPKEGAPFLVARGMPGAGGIATQAAEVGALGVARMIHIGTAGSLTPGLTESELIVSRGSWRDGAAMLLAPDDAPISRPDEPLSLAILEAAQRHDARTRRLTGFTSPVFYHQPSGLTGALLTGRTFARERPGFVEMEQAPFFETCRLQRMQCASIVVASDEWSSATTHRFLGDTGPAEKTAFLVAREVLDK